MTLILQWGWKKDVIAKIQWFGTFFCKIVVWHGKRKEKSFTQLQDKKMASFEILIMLDLSALCPHDFIWLKSSETK